MHAGDLRIEPMRVDADGLQLSERDWNAYPPRLIYTTPSRTDYSRTAAWRMDHRRRL